MSKALNILARLLKVKQGVWLAERGPVVLLVWRDVWDTRLRVAVTEELVGDSLLNLALFSGRKSPNGLEQD